MQKELNINGDRYTAYSPDNVNWVCVAEDDVIIPNLAELDILEDVDETEISSIVTKCGRDGMVGCIKALGLPIAAPDMRYIKSFYNVTFEFYSCNYIDNEYLVRIKIDKQKRRLSYYFYKNDNALTKLKKLNNIKWINEDFYG